MKLQALFLTFVLASVSCYKRYDGYKVILVQPEREFQLDYLYKLMLTKHELDFWEEPTRLGANVVFMISPEDFPSTKFNLNIHGLHLTVLYDDVQKLLNTEKKSRRKNPDRRAYDYNEFNRYVDYMQETDALAAQCPDDVICTVSVIGESIEGRDIKLLKIDTGAPREFFMDGCIHAREWLACATLMKLVNYMITESDNDPVAEEVLKSHNWHIVPIVNPDGYEYTFDVDRLWRKSRNLNEGSTCVGTDLNRNHDYYWNTGGTSASPCSDIYHGRGAASEPEVQALQNAGLEVKATGNLTVWLTMHTYAKMLLWPFGNGTKPSNEEEVRRVADRTCDAIMATFNTEWECGNAYETLYETSGTTRDWATGRGGALYSYTAELRGDYFVVDPDQIEPSFEEMWNGLQACVEEVIAIEEDTRYRLK